METIEKGTTQTLTLYAGDVLTVTATTGQSYVWRLAEPREPTPKVVIVNAGASQAVGPFKVNTRHRIESPAAPVSYVIGKTIAAPPAPTPQLDQSGTKMANTRFQDKCKLLAARAKQLPADLESTVDAVSAHIDALDKRGTTALATMKSTLVDVEAGVSATEDAVNQLTNGGPPLSDPPATPATS